ncbi:WRKY7 [Artemisia annua]|uniref:WRKY7 n=1 Tax=Artemisia annua TaxID=35608 RepID=A0A2U1PPY6_ARTAN|nr:WRKY7 [Artemisia annua]
MSKPVDEFSSRHSDSDADESNHEDAQFEAFTVSSPEELKKCYERFQHLLSQLEAHGSPVSTEDANHKFLRVFEQDLKGNSKSSSSAANVAFVGQGKTSTNRVSSGSFNPGSYASSYNNIKERDNPVGFADEPMAAALPAPSSPESTTSIVSCLQSEEFVYDQYFVQNVVSQKRKGSTIVEKAFQGKYTCYNGTQSAETLPLSNCEGVKFFLESSIGSQRCLLGLEVVNSLQGVVLEGKQGHKKTDKGTGGFGFFGRAIDEEAKTQHKVVFRVLKNKGRLIDSNGSSLVGFRLCMGVSSVFRIRASGLLITRSTRVLEVSGFSEHQGCRFLICKVFGFTKTGLQYRQGFRLQGKKKFGDVRFISQGYQNKQRVAEKKVQDLLRLQGFLSYKKYVVKIKYDKGYFKNRWGNVGQVACSQEVQNQDLIDYHSARDREQHLARELYRHRENSNEAAFAVAAVEKINKDESLTFNDTVACEVISKWKSGLKEDMDIRSDVYVLSNGCRKSSDDSDDYYCEYTPAKGNILGMEIIRDQSGNTLRGSQSRVHNRKLVQTLLEGHSILSLEGSLSGDCDVEKNGSIMDYRQTFDHGLQTDVQVFVDFDYTMGRSITVMGRSITRYGFMMQGCAGSSEAMMLHMEALSTTEAAYMTIKEAAKEAIWLKGLSTESSAELRLVAGIATSAWMKAHPYPRFQCWLKLLHIGPNPGEMLSNLKTSHSVNTYDMRDPIVPSLCSFPSSQFAFMEKYQQHQFPITSEDEVLQVYSPPFIFPNTSESNCFSEWDSNSSPSLDFTVDQDDSDYYFKVNNSFF